MPTCLLFAHIQVFSPDRRIKTRLLAEVGRRIRKRELNNRHPPCPKSWCVHACCMPNLVVASGHRCMLAASPVGRHSPRPPPPARAAASPARRSLSIVVDDGDRRNELQVYTAASASYMQYSNRSIPTVLSSTRRRGRRQIDRET
jgi:hypothetical protein